MLWLLLGLSLAQDPSTDAERPPVEIIDVRVVEEPPAREAPGAPSLGDIVAPILEYGPALPEEVPEDPTDFVGPVAPVAPPVVVVQPSDGPDLRAVFPWVSPRGFGSGLLLAFISLLFVALAHVMQRLAGRLAERGVLPSIAHWSISGSRVLAAFFGLGVVAAWAPANVAPAVPWIIVGGALAVGWSARDVLPDLVGWLALALEGRIRPGRWVSGAGFRGEVVRVGARSTVILDEWGGEVSLPNRRLVQEAWGRDPSVWPKVEVALSLPEDLDPSRARRAIHEAVLLSPWIARGEVEIGASTEGPGRWTVRVRLLEGTYLAVFEGSLRERVIEVLDAWR